MKPLRAATLSVVLSCGPVVALSYLFGADGQTLAIIAIVSAVVAGTTAWLAATFANSRTWTSTSTTATRKA